MQAREKNNIIRPDLIHLLMQAKKGSLVHDKVEEKITDTGFSTVEESAIGKSSVKRSMSIFYITYLD